MKQKLKTHFLMNLIIKATDTNFFSSRSSLKQFLNYLSRKKNNLLSSFFKFNINLETTELAPKYPANLNSKHLIRFMYSPTLFNNLNNRLLKSLANYILF